MLELFTCASSALGGGHDESIYDTFMSHLPAVLSAYTQAVNMPSETQVPGIIEKQEGRGSRQQRKYTRRQDSCEALPVLQRRATPETRMRARMP